MIKIRPYKDLDFPEVKRNLIQGDMFDPIWDSRRNLKKIIKRDPQGVLVATENDEVIGNIYLFQNGWEAHIYRLAVRTENRGNGVGPKLLQFAEKILKKRGVKEVAGYFDISKKNLEKFYKKQNYIFSKSLYRSIYKKL
jgi:ribosomal protein S18 acetylase RimI-like enzyme